MFFHVQHPRDLILEIRLPFSQVISSVVNCKIGLGCGGFAAIKMLLSLFLLCITLTCILWHILVYFHRNSCQASITNGQKIRACNSKSYYRQSSRYTASVSADLTDTRFLIGSENTLRYMDFGQKPCRYTDFLKKRYFITYM